MKMSDNAAAVLLVIALISFYMGAKYLDCGYKSQSCYIEEAEK